MLEKAEAKIDEDGAHDDEYETNDMRVISVFAIMLL